MNIKCENRALTKRHVFGDYWNWKKIESLTIENVSKQGWNAPPKFHQCSKF